MASEDRCGRFSEALAQLQSLHDAQVASLTAEVARLRVELEANRPAAEAPSHCCEATADDPPSRCGNPAALAVSEHWLRAPSRQGTGHLSSPGSPITSSGVGILTSASLRSTRRDSRNKKAIRDAPPRKGCRGWCRELFERPAFDIFMGLLIALNAVFIGMERSMARAGQQPPVAFKAMEYGFVTVYVVELAMRLVVKGIRELTNPWIRFDLFVVVCGILDVATKVVTAASSSILELVLLVRILRLARLAKVFRMMTKFNTLWLLVHGLMNSFSTQLWTCVLVSILLYVFSVLGLELLPDSQASEEYTGIVNEHFGSLFTAWLTLLQGLTMDSFSSIYRPIMLEKPYMALYFIPFVLTVPIALMNLVTAIMVNSSLDQAAKDKEAQEEMQTERRQALASLLNDMFTDLDANGSGRIDAAEMMGAPDEVHSLIFEIAEVKTRGSDRRQHLERIFDALDVDNSGDIEISEFCGGLTKMHDRDALDSMRLQKQCQKMLDKMTKLLSSRSKESLTAANSGIQFV